VISLIRPIADDFGLHPDIDRGIIACAEKGLIAGVSVCACGSAFYDASTKALSELQNARPGFLLGIHLTLTEETSLTKPSSLTDENGRFPLYVTDFVRRLIRGKVKRTDIEQEWEAQLQRLLSTGVRIDFINSHQHVHLLPGVWPVANRLARQHGIVWMRSGHESLAAACATGSILKTGFQVLALIRSWRLRPYIPTLGVLSSMRFSVSAILDRLVKYACRDRTVEIMVHPGFLTDSLSRHYGYWAAEWDREVDELEKLSTVYGALSRHGAVHRSVCSRYGGLSRGTRWFIESRARLCPFWLVEACMPRTGRILDCGCGHGYFSLYLTEASPERRVTGIDADPRKIDCAMKVARTGRETFLAGSLVVQLSTDRSTYDAAGVIDVLYQLRPQEQIAALTLLYERLKPGAVLVVKETHRHSGIRYLIAYLEECLVVSLRRKRISLRFWYRSVNGWTTVLEQAGFVVTEKMPVPAERINNRSWIIVCKRR
jgi:predicted glycoside hydrolase/deacetylase ChbG (UPF0249 family)/predicted O-methyltransferase YrrM